eukprot:TRINITY_DN15290_c0_g1_i1.p1 TRINITY_DN15290_c0_g1~~TRINITY_DN15290_c0_g1_i1.p1  ORF type:complete len:238 (-),score=37.78 TRINITY_DN15290_c0_g1_i1:227-940(-)
MTSKLDLSLDALTAQAKAANRGRGRGRGKTGGPAPRRGARGGRSQPYEKIAPRTQRLYTSNNGDDAWSHDLFQGDEGESRRVAKKGLASRVGAGGAAVSAKMQVANLDYNVSNEDLKELFSEFGEVKKVNIHFDRAGRSNGTADVIFARKTDASRAVAKYNGVELDGRPLQLQLAAVESSIQQRIKPAKPLSGRIGTSKPKSDKPAKPKKEPKKSMTAEDLDADLDAYKQAGDAPEE